MRPRSLAHAGRAPAIMALVAVAACRSKPQTSSGERPAGSAAVAPAKGESHACRELAGSPVLTLGTASAAASGAGSARDAGKALDEEDREVELPFSVELGHAASSGAGFAVPGLESRAGASFAFVALLGAASAETRSVELGRVYGDVEPPAVTAAGAGWLVAIADSDAGGTVLRLAALAPPFAAESLRRGAEIPSVRRDASGFALEASGARALLAFPRLEQDRGRIALAVIDPATARLFGELGSAPAPAASEADVEAPRLVRRPSGYYLAWIAREPAARPKPRARALEGAGAPDAGAGESERVLEDGPSAIEIVPLDADGKATASVRRLTPPDARVIAFDLAAAPDGGALVAYRDDRDGPGLDRANVQALLVRGDGSFAARAWEVGESSGVPSLLADPAPPRGAPWAFVGVGDERETRLAALGADPLELGAPAAAETLRGSELLALAHGKFLRARARGRARELSLVACTSK